MINDLYRLFANLASPGSARGKLQIFIFHRVLDRLDPLAPYEPDIVRFDRIARAISEVFNVISLNDAVEGLKKGTLPRRSACITFDDGYLDNYTNVLPLLLKYNLPATVFVATDFMDGGMMWNDVVIESVRSWHGPISIEELGVVGEQCGSDHHKREFLSSIIPKIKYMPPGQRAEVVAAIEEKTGYQRQPLMMSSEQIVAMRDSGITIGAHTRSHPILANLDDRNARYEIAESREILENLLKDKVGLFAYPNGIPSKDYSQRDVSIVKELGFNAAVSTRKNIATRNDGIYELPRFTPWDENVNKFMLRSLFETLKQ